MLGLLGWTVLSKAACCFFRITSANFCLTTLLATAPAGAKHYEWLWVGGQVAALAYTLAYCTVHTPSARHPRDSLARGKPEALSQHSPFSTPT